MSAPEFSRPIALETLGSVPSALSIEASEAERAALARRFGLEAIGRLSAEVALTRSGDQAAATGTLRAHVIQSCVVSAVPVAASVEEGFRIDFRPQPARTAEEDEIELSEDELDVVFYEGAAIDIGEAVAETLSLSLEPYPRARDAEDTLREAGMKSEEEAGPFGGLAALRDTLKS